MDESKPVKELSDRLKRRLNTGESAYFASQSQYRTKKCPDGKWLVKVRRLERGRIVEFPVKGFERPEDAIKYAESTRPEARKSSGVGQVQSKFSGDVHTVSDLYNYCKAHTWKRLSGRRIEEKESRWKKHIEPYWGPWPISTIRRKAAQEWVTEKESALIDGKGLSQLSECRFDLIGYFKTAIKMDFYEFGNPFELIDFIPPTPRARITIESQQFADVLATMDLLVEADQVLRWTVDTFTIALLTGMREGEILGLQGSRIHLDKKAIFVDRALGRKARMVGEDGVPFGPVLPQALSYPKGGTQADPKSRWVAIPDQLMAIMTRLKASTEVVCPPKSRPPIILDSGSK